MLFFGLAVGGQEKFKEYTFCKYNLRRKTEFVSGVSSPGGLGSSCCDQPCPPFKVNPLLKGLHCIRSSKLLGKRVQRSAPFQSIRMLDSTFQWGGSCTLSWGEGEVSDMIRYLILCFRAKAICFPQFININSFRFRKGVSLKNIIPPFQFTVNSYPLSKQRRYRL